MKEQFRLEARQHYVTIAEELCKKVLGDNDAAIAKSLNKLIYEL
jgi:hypothetical protein